MNARGFNAVSEHQYINQDAGLIIEFTQLPGDIGKENTTVPGADGLKVMGWGERNTLPEDRELLIMDNNIIGELLSTKRSIILGQGLKPYVETIDEETGEVKHKFVKIPQEIEEWMWQCDFDNKYLVEGANQLFMHANIPTAMMTDKLGSKINKIMSYKCRDMRAVMKPFGKPIESYLFGNFSKSRQTSEPRTYIPIPVYRDGVKGEFMYWVSDSLIHDGYYAHPVWWGGKEWIELSNSIPKFHIANIRNGYTIRYHIEIPRDTFLNKQKYLDAESQSDQSAISQCLSDADNKKKQFLDDMNRWLSGEDNAGRAIYTFFDTTEEGKKIDGVIITPLTVDLKDESLLKLYEKSNQANISAIGIHPTLASIETAGKLSSGSEFRSALDFYVKVKAPIYRRLLLRPWEFVWKFNKWDQKYPEMKWKFADTTLARLDEEKSGVKEVSTVPEVGA